MSRIPYFLAVSSFTRLSSCIRLERGVCQVGTVLRLPCVYKDPNIRLRHINKDSDKKERIEEGTYKEKKHSIAKKSSKPNLPQASVPEELWQVYSDRNQLLKLVPSLTEELSLKNYEEKFTALLHLEEIQHEINLRNLDMKNVSFRYDGISFNLYVPAVAAGFLSLMPDDQILVTHATNSDFPRQQATVKMVNNGHLELAFSREFEEMYDQDLPEWNIQFTLNRVSLRRCHRAVNMVQKLDTEVLFPTELSLQPPYRVINSDQEFIDQYLDEQQRMAVKQIVSGESRPTPYIVFGPPGTGKTVTIVEAILQIYTKIPGSRILVCAPSNNAVNLLVQKLHRSGVVDPGRMARHFAERVMQEEQSIPESVRPYSIVIDNISQTYKYKILLTTCNSAAILISLGLKEGHYTHVFIDEAGQATEPDSLIPLVLLSSEDGQLILSGDPHQLGPFVLSGTAERFGLEISLLQRLMELPLYSRDEEKFAAFGSYNPLLVTKLINNYRSHPCILQPSSRMFYHDELEAEGSTSLTHSLCNWQELPVPGVPLIFHSIKGTEQIGFKTPSRCNLEEATAVVRYVKRMFETIQDLEEKHIGIITPYRLQVETIEEEIAAKLYKKIDVGTVEFFQGQERKIIIISTVRSSEETYESDISLLGFVDNPKRLNVSITRAQSLLIVIGNPVILCRNQFWKAFIDYCKQLGVYINHKRIFNFNSLKMEK